MIAGGAQVLAYGEKVNAAAAEIAKHFDEFVRRFAEAHHHAALGHHAGGKFPGTLEQVESALVTSAGAYGAIETGHGFSIVVEDVGPGIEHDFQWLFQTLKIRDQDFNAAIWNEFANLADGFGENFSAAYVVVIAVDAGHYGMFQTQRGNGFGDAAGFVPVDRLWAAFGYGAESAAAGANIAQKHEGCGLVIPAFADVGTLGRLAYGVKSESA